MKWGLPLDAIINLGERLSSFYERFSQCFRTQTRDTSEYGLKYISGLLRMETDRNLANVGRKTETSGQNLQHFVSNSSWDSARVIVAVEEQVTVHPVFQDAISVLDAKRRRKGWVNTVRVLGVSTTGGWVRSK